jgi:hypothetical protein
VRRGARGGRVAVPADPAQPPEQEAEALAGVARG